MTLEKTRLLTKMPLFAAGETGYHVCRIPGLVVTQRGVVLASAEARRGSGGVYDDIDLLIRRSSDGGKTWDAPQLLASNVPYGPGPMPNLSMICDRTDGSVHAVYCYDYARVFYVRSRDDGKTFSPPVEITASVAEYRKGLPVGNGRNRAGARHSIAERSVRDSHLVLRRQRNRNGCRQTRSPAVDGWRDLQRRPWKILALRRRRCEQRQVLRQS